MSRCPSVRRQTQSYTYSVYVSHPPSRIYSYMCVEVLKLASVSSSNNNSCFQRCGFLISNKPTASSSKLYLQMRTKKKFGRPEVQSDSTQKWRVKFASKNPNSQFFLPFSCEFVINSLS